MQPTINEICRLWLNKKGKTAVTSRSRTAGYYLDSFNLYSPIILRQDNNLYWHIADTAVYPRFSAIKELRRNGLKGGLPDTHPMRLMQALLTDHCIETMVKAKAYRAVAHFIAHPKDLDTCWASYKVATRRGYTPEDYKLWCDMVCLLDKCGRDTRSSRYICPQDLKAEHDKWLKRVNDMERKRRDRERLERAKAQEADFYKNKSCYFGIVIQDADIEVSVLNSLEAYKSEADHMHHCVFQCEYYAKTDTIILSAHDKNGNRIETVEFSLTQGKVVQSRGVCNTNTDQHDRIIQLVNDNAHLFLEAKKSA
jgi:hypothetical protein